MAWLTWQELLYPVCYRGESKWWRVAVIPMAVSAAPPPKESQSHLVGVHAARRVKSSWDNECHAKEEERRACEKHGALRKQGF